MTTEQLTVCMIDPVDRTVTIGEHPVRSDDTPAAWHARAHVVPFRGPDHPMSHALGCPCHLGSGYRIGQVVEVVTP